MLATILPKIFYLPVCCQDKHDSEQNCNFPKLFSMAVKLGLSWKREC
jgi:hypothetical protein